MVRINNWIACNMYVRGEIALSMFIYVYVMPLKDCATFITDMWMICGAANKSTIELKISFKN